MKTKLIIKLSLPVCLALSLTASETTKLQSVDVTDTAFNEYVKTITSEKLDNLQASDIKDILKSMPSVIVDSNSRYAQKVYVRGLEDKFSNVTIDGARMSGQLFHHSGDQTIDAEMLKLGSVELGPNSALSGAGVINGSFVYETKDPSDYLKKDETFGGQVSAGYQSAYNRKSTSIALFSKVNEKFEVITMGNVVKDTKIEIPGKDDVTSKQSKLQSGLVKFIYKPSDASTIKLSYNKYSDGGDRQIDGEKAGSTNDQSNSEINRETYTLNYNYNPESELVNTDFKLYKNSQKLTREADVSTYNVSGTRNVDGNVSNPKRDYENSSKGFDLRNASLVSNHLLTYGVDYYHDEQEKTADDVQKYLTGSRAGTTANINIGKAGEIKAHGLYLEDEINLDSLLLNIGARYDSHKMGGIYSGTFSQLSPKFKASYQALDDLKLRVAYGRIFKGPALGETLMLQSDTTQSVNTKAQTGHNYELGFDYDLSQSLNAKSSKIGMTLYTYNVDNYMHPTHNVTLGASADIKTAGIETVFNYKKDKLALNLSHTYAVGKTKSLSTKLKTDLTTAKIHTFKIGTDYNVNKNLFLNYNAEIVPENSYTVNFRGSALDVDRKAYQVHNVNLAYKIAALDGAKINFGIDNLFDAKYSRHTSFGTYFDSESYTAYEVGRNYKVKLSYRF